MAGDRSARPDAFHSSLHLLLQLIAATFAPPRRALERDLASHAFAAAVQVLADATGVTAPNITPLTVASLQPAYVDLFVTSARHPISPPYAGYALDGELLGPSAEVLGRFLAAHQIGTDPNWRDLPDHVAAVAEAGAILAANGDDDAARTVAGRYLAPWFDRYAAEVRQNDQSDFYGPMTMLLHDSLQHASRRCEPHPPRTDAQDDR